MTGAMAAAAAAAGYPGLSAPGDNMMQQALMSMMSPQAAIAQQMMFMAAGAGGSMEAFQHMATMAAMAAATGNPMAAMAQNPLFFNMLMQQNSEAMASAMASATAGSAAGGFLGFPGGMDWGHTALSTEALAPGSARTSGFSTPGNHVRGLKRSLSSAKKNKSKGTLLNIMI
jgi:hypothetical protein